MRDWQSIYSDQREYRIEIVKAVLEDNGLKPVSVNKKIAPYDIGTFEVLVSPDEVLRAIKIVNEEIKFE